MLTEDERLVILRSSDEFEEDNENYKDYDNEQSGADDILFYIHHSDLARLQKSADNGCQFCYQLCYGALGRALEAHNEWCDVQGIFLELETVHLVPPDNEQCYRGALTVHLGMKYSGEMRLREPACEYPLYFVPNMH
jgi:hypothetical protein